MSRIKKRGLDYFPMNTDFMHDRLVRRIMKREGDGALAILLGTISCIYADEGYYVVADELFYEDLSACLYQQSAADVKRILALAVEYGIFDAELFARHSILTSAEIQRQYLFSTKRRKSSALDARYRLLDDAQADAGENGEENGEENAEAGINVTFKPENVTSGTHSIAQHSIAQHSTENPLLHSSPENGGTEGADRKSAEEVISIRREAPATRRKTPAVREEALAAREETPLSKEEEYRRKLANLQPPQDGLKRNLSGLLLNLELFNIPPQEQYAIVLKSNFGIIGHPMWRGFGALRESHGKIRQPGRYLLSLCNK